MKAEKATQIGGSGVLGGYLIGPGLGRRAPKGRVFRRPTAFQWREVTYGERVEPTGPIDNQE